MKSFAEFLIEKTFNVQIDVDYLYTKSKLDVLVSLIDAGDIEGLRKFLSKGKTFLSISSNELKSRSAKQASKIKPVLIDVGVFKGGSYYDTRTNYIQLSLNKSALQYFMTLDLDPKNAERELNKVSNRFMKEFKPSAIKGTIAHELAHWIDDVLHNQFLSNRVTIAREKGIIGLAGKHNDVNHTEFEVNSQIHAIKEIKRSMGAREYNKITWIGLIQQKSSLMSNFKHFLSESDYNEFMISFVKRLHREKLLAKTLKHIPSYREMKSILNNY